MSVKYYNGQQWIELAGGQQGPPGPQGPAGPTGPQGDQGEPGEDGFSPSASVSKVGSIATISITDKDGTTTASISDGDGVPAGGSTGQSLRKASATDYDVVWGTPGVTWTTLWTNPSPSSSFAAQTVTLTALASYQFVYIAARLATDSSSTKAGVMVPLGINAVKGGNINGASATYAYFRGFTINSGNTEVEFTKAYRFDGNGTNSGNGYLIPYRIYGGKIN